MKSSSSRPRRGAPDQPVHNKIATAIFAAVAAAGISDRSFAERITEQVIGQIDKGGVENRLPLPGMEELIGQVKQRSARTISPAQLEDMVGDMLARMGHVEVAKAYMSAKDASVKTTSNTEKKSVTVIEPQMVSGSQPELSGNAARVLEKRYLKKDSEGKVIETPQDMFRRVAAHIASAELNFNPKADVKAIEDEFYRLMTSLEFLPNSPTLMNAGRELGQLSACFVLPIEDTMESIFDAVKYTALIHKSGGGTGFSFSRIRPENDRVGSTGGVASGPISFIRAFDVATDVIKQGGMRRGANMAILSVDHPDIMKFIDAKKDGKSFSNFNFSVAVTEKFMKAVESGGDFDLVNPRTGQLAGKLNATEVFEKIVNGAWQGGDPGIVFIDRINRDNPTPNLGKIESTNPCGEQPLLPYESCNLGSINLARMLKSSSGSLEIDFDKLGATVRAAVRFLDNVIEVNVFPLPEIEKMTRANRKVGLGVMGFADMLIRLGIPYNSEKALDCARRVMKFINEESKKASAALSEERGVFPTFNDSVHNRPNSLRLRNAATTTIAPTGTLSIIGNCSSGIEPLFAVSYTRTILEGEQFIEVNPVFEEVARARGFYSDKLMKEIAKHGTIQGVEAVPEDVRKVFVTAHDVTPEWHVRMQAAFQLHTDNAVSKTVNFPREATREDVARVYQLACEEGCKGITIYRDGSKEGQVLSTQETAKPREAAPLTPRERPKRTQGITQKVSTGCGSLYVTVNRDSQGICEVFSSLGKAGGCASAQLEAISRLISLAMRSGLDVPSIVKHLRGIRCPSIAWEEGHAVLSCPDAIGSVLEMQVEPANSEETAPAPHAEVEVKIEKSGNGKHASLVGQCPDCASQLVYQEGCYFCRHCGYTRCS